MTSIDANMAAPVGEQDFLDLFSSLCSLVAAQNGLSDISRHRKARQAKALQNVLFPSDAVRDDEQCELARLRGLWWQLLRCGRRSAAARLRRQLDQLGGSPAVEVRCVLRLLLQLADPELCQRPPPPPLGRLTDQDGLLPLGQDWCQEEVDDAPTSPPRLPTFPKDVFLADASLGRPLESRSSSSDAALVIPPLLSEPGGPLGALVRARCRVEVGEKLRLPPLPLDPWHPPLPPESRVTDGWPEDVRRLAPTPTAALPAVTPSSLSGELEWDQVWRLPAGGRLGWEHRGRRQQGRLPPCLSGAGPPAAAALRRLSLSCRLESQPTAGRAVHSSRLLRELRMMMMGLHTHCFPLDVNTAGYRPRPGLCTDTLTPEALADRCATWLQCGTWCSRVAALVTGSGGGSVLQAFRSGLEPCLRSYRCAMSEVRADTLVEFGRKVMPLTRLMALMADLACVENTSSELPQKMALITDLFDRLVGASEVTERALVAHLFQATIAPYLRFLSLWLREGLVRDPHGEFAISELEEFSGCDGELFWTDAFRCAAVGSDRNHPRFLQGVSAAVFQCGRALALLRRCQPYHPLCRPDTAPPLQLAFSAPQLQHIHRRVLRYEASVRLQMPTSFSQHSSERRCREAELPVTAAERRHHTMQTVEANQHTTRQQEADDKRQLLQQLASAAEQARSERRQVQLEERILTEKVAAERRQMEQKADEQERKERLARVEWLAARTLASAAAVPGASVSGATVDADSEESMSTSADISPEVELPPGGTSNPDRIGAPTGVSMATQWRHAGGVVLSDGTDGIIPTSGLLSPDTLITATDDNTNYTVTACSDQNANLATTTTADTTGTLSAPVLSDTGQLLAGLGQLQQLSEQQPSQLSEQKVEQQSEQQQLPLQSEELEQLVELDQQSVLIDVVGGEVLRRRGRNVHGHATDSRIQRLIYYGRGETEPAARPVSGPLRWFQPTCLATAPSFLPPQLQGALPMVMDASVSVAGDDTPCSEALLAGDGEQLGAAAAAGHGTADPKAGEQLGGAAAAGHGTADSEAGEQTAVAVGDGRLAEQMCQFTLAGSLTRSVSLLVSTQLSLVNAVLLQHLLVTSQLPEQLQLLRSCLLLADGGFATRLSSRLFHLVDTARTPHQLLNPLNLNAVLGDALTWSGVGDNPLSERLSFAIASVPDVLDRAAPEVLDCLELNFVPGWPQCVVVTQESLQYYRRLFQLLLRQRRATAALETAFRHLKAAGDRQPSADQSARLQRLQLCRHQMQHFLLTLQQYFTSQMLLVGWVELQRQLETVTTVEQLRTAHLTYIQSAANRCLLNAKAEPIMRVISDILRLVLKFEYQLSTLESWLWESTSDRQFHTLLKVSRQFAQYSRFFFKVVSKAQQRHYQPHVTDLVARLSLNDHYSTGVVSGDHDSTG